MKNKCGGGWPGSPGDPPAASFHPWRLPEGLVQDWHTARRSLVELILLAIVLLIGHQLPTRLGRRSCVCPTRLHLSGGVTLRLHAVPRSHRERVGHMGGADTHRRVLLHRTRPGVLRESNTYCSTFFFFFFIPPTSFTIRTLQAGLAPSSQSLDTTREWPLY